MDLKPKLSYANVVSTLCLLLVLGGGTLAIASSNTKVIKRVVRRLAPGLSVNHAASADSATNAGHAASADSATSAQSAGSATNATHAVSADSATSAQTAGSATNASSLGGLDSSAYGYGITSVSYNPDEATTQYMPGLGSSFGPASATESSVDLETPETALIARDLRAQVEGSAPGSGKFWTITLRANGASTGLSCTISGTIFTTVCAANGPSSEIPPGSELTLQVVPINAPNPASAMSIAFRYGPA